MLISREQKKKLENMELVIECCPQHYIMKTARKKINKRIISRKIMNQIIIIIIIKKVINARVEECEYNLSEKK